MNTVKKLHVNKKARCLNKKVVLKLMIGVAIIGTIISIPVVTNAHNKKIEEQQNQTIVTYYGEESAENNILKYIDLSEKINKLNLKSYNIEDSMYKRYNISDKLKSLYEIEEYIEKFKLMNSYISSKDIAKQSENIDIVLNLAMQERLVNSYIYNIGYSTANKNVTSATKKYAAEVFDIEDPSNVYFDYFIDNTSAESNTEIINKTPDENARIGKQTYKFDNLLENKEEKIINEGVISMVETDVLDDKIFEDNGKYNQDRNNIIRKALANSADLEEQVENYDLYNEKMANKMK